MRQVRVVVGLSVCLVGVSGAAISPRVGAEQATTKMAAASPLEGTAWSVNVVPDEAAKQQGEKSFEDGLIFKDGKVTLTACVKVGFAPSTYTAEPVGGAWTLATEQISPDQGQTQWAAEISGDTINGTMVWTKQDGTVLHYTFQGSKEETKPSAS